jgi:hypothetical protein
MNALLFAETPVEVQWGGLIVGSFALAFTIFNFYYNSILEEIRQRFDADVERFSDLETGRGRSRRHYRKQIKDPAR